MLNVNISSSVGAIVKITPLYWCCYASKTNLLVEHCLLNLQYWCKQWLNWQMCQYFKYEWCSKASSTNDSTQRYVVTTMFNVHNFTHFLLVNAPAQLMLIGSRRTWFRKSTIIYVPASYIIYLSDFCRFLLCTCGWERRVERGGWRRGGGLDRGGYSRMYTVWVQLVC